VSLHGAGGDAQHGLSFVEAAAERWGFLVLAPQSRRPTWDVIQGGFGPDVANLDLSLRAVFAALNVDPRHLAIGGFSDGASYALSLGLTNGALFDHVLAFSPGFASPGQAEGKPHIFISHGTLDAVLPIERCSRRLAPALTRAGLEVDYVEFVGPHTVPERMVERAVTGWLGPAVTLPSGRT
jgi:phospholipase/carboxylesterase